MSENPEPPPPATVAAPTPAAGSQKTRRRGKWRRRLLRAVLVLVLLLLALRVALPYVAPWGVAKVGGMFELDVELADLELSVFQGRAQLRGLEVRPKRDKADGDGSVPAETLLQLDLASADVDLRALLSGELRVSRVHVDGLRARISRDAAGRWNLIEVIEGFTGSWDGDDDEPEEEPQVDEPPGPFPLESPVRVDALRLQNVVLEFEDLMQEPPFLARATVEASISDVGAPDKDAKIAFSLHAPGLVDVMRLDGVIEQGPDAVSAVLDAAVSNLRPAPAAPYLALIGIEPRAETITLGLDVHLSAERLAEDPSAVSVSLEASEMRAVADGRTDLGLRSGRAGLERLSLSDLDGFSAEIAGLRAKAGIGPSGALLAAGLRFGAPASEAPAAKQAEPKDPAAASKVPVDPKAAPAAPAASSGPPAFLAMLRTVALSDAQLTFYDESVSPKVEIDCHIDRGFLIRERGDADSGVMEPAALHLELRAPGLVETLTVDGQGRLFVSDRVLELELNGEGITLDRLRPYLEPAGIEPELVAGSLNGVLNAHLQDTDDGGLIGGLAISEVRYEDQGEMLLGVESIALQGFEFEPGRALRFGETTLSGVDLPLHRTADGVSHVIGLAIRPVKVALAPVTAAIAEAQAEKGVEGAAEQDPQEPEPVLSFDMRPPELPLPVIEFGRVACVETRLHIRDDALTHPLDVRLADMGIELTGLTLIADPAAARQSESSFRVWLRAPGLVEALDVNGSIAVAPGCRNVQLGLAVDASGVAPDLLSEYIAEVGVESRLRSGELIFELAFELTAAEEALEAAFGVTGLRLTDRGRTLLAMDAFDVVGVRVDADGISVDSIALVGPSAALSRDHEGGLHGLGFRHQKQLNKAPQAEAAPTASSEEAPKFDPVGDLLAPLAQVPFPISLRSFELSGASLRWRDEAVWPAVHTELGASLHLADLRAAPGTLEFSVEGGVQADEAFSELRASARGVLGLETVALEGGLELDGLHPGELEVYFPAGARIGVEDGGMRASFGLALDAHAEGGRTGLLELKSFTFTDKDGSEPLLTVGRAALDAKRMDADLGVFDLQEVLLSGVVVAARLSEDAKTLELAGIEFPLSSTAGSPSAAAKAKAKAAKLTGKGDDSRTWASFLQQRTELPHVRLGKLDVGLERLVLEDASRPDAEPIVLTARAKTNKPQHLLSPEPETLNALELSCELVATPLLSDGKLELSLSPFAPDPLVSGSLDVSGIDVPRIAKLVPSLAQYIDPDGIDDGHVETKFEARLAWRRSSPLDFDLRNGFSGDLRVLGLELHNGKDERALAGVDAILVDIDRIAPRTGDVLIRSIEIERPHGYARKGPDGVRALGLFLPTKSMGKAPADSAAPATPAEAKPVKSEPAQSDSAQSETTAPPKAAPSSSVPAAAAVAPKDSTAELRVGQLLVSGIDFVLEDSTVDPPAMLPLTDLELDVRRFTTRGFVERRPFTIRMRLNSGDIELPVRESSGHVLLGMVGGVTSAISGSKDKVKLEERPAFDEIAIDGVLALAPVPDGRIDLRIRELELLTFQAIAKEQKIDLRDGLMESNVGVTFAPDGDMVVKARTVFEHLSVSEPVGGPISSVLKLPAPLDTVLWVLQDDRGRQVVPLKFTVQYGEISKSQIVRQATNAFLRVVTDALTSSPLRIGKGLLDFTGIGSLTGLTGNDGPSELVGETIEVQYAPVSTAPPTKELESKQDEIVAFGKEEKVRVVLTHRFGAGDIKRAEELANPPPELVLDLGERLRQRRSALLAERTRLARLVSALHGIGRADHADSSRQHVRELDRELAQTERALDDVYSQLAPGAGLRSARRTKEAALDIARQRLDALRDRLVEMSDGRLEGRIEIRAPRYRDPAEADTGGGVVTIEARKAK